MLQSVGSILKKFDLKGLKPKSPRGPNSSFYLSTLDLSILKILTVLACTKPWVQVDQKVILRLLRTYYNIDVTDRTLRRHLKLLEDLGYIQRRRMWRRICGGLFRGLPNIYVLKVKTLKFLKGLVKFVRRIASQLRTQWEVVLRRDPDLAFDIDSVISSFAAAAGGT